VVGRVMGGARVVPVPAYAVKQLLKAMWRLHVVPAEPPLMDMVMGLPLLDTSRLRGLGWTPRVPADEALREVLTGMAQGAGGPSPSQAPDSAAERVEEVASGIGEKSTSAG
jgi:UDP-glucose 4-epimerase